MFGSMGSGFAASGAAVVVVGAAGAVAVAGLLGRFGLFVGVGIACRASGRGKEVRRPTCGSSRAEERVLGMESGVAGVFVDRRFVSSLMAEFVMGTAFAFSSFVVEVAFVLSGAVSDVASGISVSSRS